MRDPGLSLLTIPLKLRAFGHSKDLTILSRSKKIQHAGLTTFAIAWSTIARNSAWMESLTFQRLLMLGPNSIGTRLSNREKSKKNLRPLIPTLAANRLWVSSSELRLMTSTTQTPAHPANHSMLMVSSKDNLQ